MQADMQDAAGEALSVGVTAWLFRISPRVLVGRATLPCQDFHVWELASVLRKAFPVSPLLRLG